MHGDTIVPYHQVERPPDMRIDELPLRRVLVEVAQEGTRLKVLHVMRNSPAAESGWRAGVQICAIDGIGVADADSSVIQGWSVGAPGRQVRLTLCGGSERSLTLARFY